MGTDDLSRRLSKVGWRGNIKLKLHNSQLRFEQLYPPPTYDDMETYLHQLLDLLCDLAEAAKQSKS